MYDLAGLRIVVGTSWELENVANFFVHPHYGRNEFKLIKDKPVDKKGYRARHIVVQWLYWLAGVSGTTRVEVQLQTVFQHAYNTLSRSWIYKNVPNWGDEWDKDFLELSKHLKELEAVADRLHEGWSSKGLPVRPQSNELNPFILKNTVREILEDDIEYHAAISPTVWLHSLGVHTVDFLRDFLTRPDVEALWNEALALSQSDNDYLRGIGDGMTERGKFQFWFFWGVRTDECRKFIDLAKTKSPGI